MAVTIDDVRHIASLARLPARVDYLCWNDACLGIGRWSVILGVDGEPLDDADGDCPSCGEPGEADPDA